MPLRVKVHDFQALADVDITAEGLTVITGASNVGKTALIRAISAAIFGKPGDHFIRRGSDYTTVSLEDAAGKLDWLKTTKPRVDRQTHLKVDGQVHTKLGRDHWRLTEPLGFLQLDTNYNSYRPQLAFQHDAPFLLFDNPTEIAEVMKQVARSDVTTKATDMARKDRRDADSTAKVKADDLIKARQELDELDGLAEIETTWSALKKDYDTFRQKEAATLRTVELLKRLPTLQPLSIPDTPPEVTRPSALELLLKLQQLPLLQPIELPEDPPQVNAPNLKLKQLELLQSFQQATADLLAAKEAITGLEAQLETTNQEIRELERELGVCPTCSKPFETHDATH